MNQDERARLTAERDEARRQLAAANEWAKVMEHERDFEQQVVVVDLERRLDDAVAERDRLRDALRQIQRIDEWLDGAVAETYKDQPLAQDWARVAKTVEEAGEAVEALIALTGQNPRKPQRDEARQELIDELADVALTAVLAIQHFEKDSDATAAIVRDRLSRLYERAALAESEETT